MKTVFEMVSQEALPLVRALVSKNLLEDGFSQKKIADKLGLTQAAVSQYKNNVRGKKVGIFSENPQIFEDIRKISRRVVRGEIDMNEATLEVFETCKRVIRND